MLPPEEVQHAICELARYYAEKGEANLRQFMADVRRSLTSAIAIAQKFATAKEE